MKSADNLFDKYRFSAPKYADVNKTGGSILNANYPLKWVNFACLFTVVVGHEIFDEDALSAFFAQF